ncbi:MAG: GNAT family N-acetyltransferase [Deltaproteobacteria bacterium]|nr:GNAT family N-acetyltransferase [Deltaproteobacteria bacterium]
MNEIRISDSLYLNRASLRDAAVLVSLLNDPVYAQMTQHIPYPYATEDAKQWIHLNLAKKDTDLTKVWCIRACYQGQTTTQLCGMIGVPRLSFDEGWVEVGYWVGKAHWGKGMATQSVHALSKWISTNPSVQKIIAHTFTNNTASGRVLEKNGFSKTKKIKNYISKNGKMISAFYWEKPLSNYLS